MTKQQLKTVASLRNMNYRFNEVVANGKTLLLRSSVTLLSGKTLVRNVAEVKYDGKVQMEDTTYWGDPKFARHVQE